MKIVIDIPEKYYNYIKEMQDEMSTAELFIKTGEPLKTADDLTKEEINNLLDDLIKGEKDV